MNYFFMLPLLNAFLIKAASKFETKVMREREKKIESQKYYRNFCTRILIKSREQPQEVKCEGLFSECCNASSSDTHTYKEYSL